MKQTNSTPAPSPGEKAGSDGHGGYLITDHGNHLPTTRDGKPDRRLFVAAFEALHGGFRGHKFGHTADGKPVPELARLIPAAKRKLIGKFHQQGWPLPSSGKS